MIGIGVGFTVQELLDRVKEEDIYEKYFSKVILGRKFPSVFRNENTPSMEFFIGNRGNILINDFGSTKKSYDAIGFVAELFKVSYQEAINKIAKDFGITRNTESKGYLNTIYNRCSEKPALIIEVKYRNWNRNDKNYWFGKYGIHSSTLEKFQIRPITHFWINGSRNVAEDNSYCYHYFKDIDGRWLLRIYQPLTTNPFNKWFGNTGSKQIIQGEGVLPKEGALLLITKSLKDVCQLYEYNINAIAPITETSFPNELYLLKQRKRFKKIVIFYDNDEQGTESALKFSKIHNLPIIVLDKSLLINHNVKDITDFVEKFGFNEGREMMAYLISQLNYEYV